MVESYFSPSSKSIKRRTLFNNEKDDWVVQWFNLQQANFATKQCYSSKTQELKMIDLFAKNTQTFDYKKHLWFKDF